MAEYGKRDRVILARRRICQPVTGGRGGIDHLLDPRRPGAFQHPHSALYVRRHVVDGLLDRRHDVANPSVVNEIRHALEDRMVARQIADIQFLETQVRVARMMGKIAFVPADQIVDHPDGIARLQRYIDHMRANEARAARDQ